MFIEGCNYIIDVFIIFCPPPSPSKKKIKKKQPNLPHIPRRNLTKKGYFFFQKILVIKIPVFWPRDPKTVFFGTFEPPPKKKFPLPRKQSIFWATHISKFCNVFEDKCKKILSSKTNTFLDCKVLSFIRVFFP